MRKRTKEVQEGDTRLTRYDIYRINKKNIGIVE